jgi:tight adherence protein B
MTGILVMALLLVATVVVAVPGGSRARLARLTGRRQPLWPWLLESGRRALARVPGSQRWAVPVVGCGAGLFATAGYGPVAGMVAGAYGGLAARVVLRRRTARVAQEALHNTLDGLACLVGDLRAGIPPAAALDAALPLLTVAGVTVAGGVTSMADLTRHADSGARGRVLVGLAAAWQVAETAGAPLGDVLDRLDAEVRSGERARALAAAQSASAQVTAVLLGALPLAGVILGYGMGADPLAVLFGTPLGAVCAITAVVLQLAGLGWTRRLAAIDPTRVDLTGVGR